MTPREHATVTWDKNFTTRWFTRQDERGMQWLIDGEAGIADIEAAIRAAAAPLVDALRDLLETEHSERDYEAAHAALAAWDAPS